MRQRYKKTINKENCERILLEFKKIILNEPYYDVMIAYKHFGNFIRDHEKWVRNNEEIDDNNF